MARSQFRMFKSAISGVEAVAADSSQSFARHTHEQFGIGLVSSGAQKSLSGRGMVEAGAGDIITVNPNEVHDGMPIGEGRSWRILYFDPEIVATDVSDITEGRRSAVEIAHPVLHDKTIAAQFEAAFALVVGTGEHRLQREEALLVLIAHVVSEAVANDAQAAPRAIRIAQEMIDCDPTAAISLSDLARASQLSRFQVLRGFAKATGLTPHAYLVQRRIHLARRLIAGGVALAEAALASGFADQSHMTRVFVRKYGISPRTYANAVA
ncbi:AraC family transcriptional regulator [Rhizobium grahamii]|uniref:AraC family transcriptional regulator n=1 Tax=Rhizobium grahamii TaxID=1120045 RepID=A0A370KPN3_9HYPH|nr:AraC family transcriptional regulator [Rhizobium grahamii]RDJ11302.1 AraC family transcriptional regulator [Rhizobium grahamii]